MFEKYETSNNIFLKILFYSIAIKFNFQSIFYNKYFDII